MNVISSTSVTTYTTVICLTANKIQRLSDKVVVYYINN